MKALPHNPLPLATTSALTPRRSLPGPVAGAAWSSALDRASHEVHGVLRPAPGMATMPETARSALGPHTVQVASTGAVTKRATQPALGTEGVEQQQTRDLVIEGTAAALQRSDEEPEPTVDRPRRRFMWAPDDRSPIRMHIEQQADGVAVWIGCDARVPRVDVAALLAAIKSPCAATAPVAAVVCNGTPVYVRNPRPQESP